MEIAELSVRVTADDQFTGQFEQTAGRVESRAKSMGDRVARAFSVFASASTLGSVRKLRSTFDDQAAKIEQRSESLQRNVGRVFAGVGVGLIGGLAIDRALGQFDQLDVRAREVLTLLNDQTPSAFRGLTEDILDFQEELRISSEQTVPALYQAISAGQGSDPFGFLETAREAAIGGISSLETSVKVLSGTVNAYGDEAVTAERVSDVLFTAVKSGVTTFDELAAGLPKVTATAASFGITIESTAAAVAALTKNGIATSEASTFLNAALVELARSGTEANKTFTELSGESFLDFIANGGDLVDVIKLISTASTETDLSVVDMFGSVEAGKAVLALTRNEGEVLVDTLDDMAGSYGATAKAAETMELSAENTRARIAALIQTAQQRFGAELAGGISDLLTIAEDLAPVLIDLATTLGGTFALGLELAVPVVGVLADALGVLASLAATVPGPLLAIGYAAAGGLTPLGVATTAMFKFATNTALFAKAAAAAKTGVSTLFPAIQQLAAGSASAVGPLSALRLAVPALGVALVGAAVAWRTYKNAQQDAQERTEAYGQAVRDLATPEVDKMSKRVNELAISLGLLRSELSDTGLEGLTAEAAGLLGVLESVSEQTDFDGLDALQAKLGLVNADLELLGNASLSGEGFSDFTLFAGKFVGSADNMLDSLRALADASDDPLTSAAAAEVVRLAEAAGLTRGELEVLLQSLGRSQDAAEGFGQALEATAISTLDDLRDSSGELTKSMVDQAVATAKATDSATPYRDALAEVQTIMGDLEASQRDAGFSLDSLTETQKTSLEIWAESGATLEDLSDAWDDLTPTLTDVDNVLDSINDGMRETFNIGLSQRQAIQELDAAYEDLTESLGGFIDESDSAERIDELTEAYKREIETGIGPKAIAIADEIAAEQALQAARVESLRTLSDLDDAGREAFNLLVDYSDQVLDSAESQIAAGESIGSVADFLREQESVLFDVGVAAGISESAMIDYVTTLDTTPESLETLISLVGPEAAIVDIAGIIASMGDIPDEVKAEIALLGSEPSIEAILGVITKMDEFDRFEAQAEISVGGRADVIAEVQAAQKVLDAFNKVEYTAELRAEGVDPVIAGLAAAQKESELLEAADVELQISLLGEDETILGLTEVELAAADVEESDPEIEVTALVDRALDDLFSVEQQIEDILQYNGSTVSVDVLTTLTGSGLPGAEAGGVFDVRGPGVPVRIGESGREYAIPVANPKYRDRAMALLSAAARDLGVQVSQRGTEGPRAPSRSQAGEATSQRSAEPVNVESNQSIEVHVMDYSDQGQMARRISLDLSDLIGSM